jgi:hypothetical protein
LPSVDHNTKIAENKTEENSVLIALTEIGCLDELSLEEDMLHNVSNMSSDR